MNEVSDSFTCPRTAETASRALSPKSCRRLCSRRRRSRRCVAPHASLHAAHRIQLRVLPLTFPSSSGRRLYNVSTDAHGPCQAAWVPSGPKAESPLYPSPITRTLESAHGSWCWRCAVAPSTRVMKSRRATRKDRRLDWSSLKPSAAGNPTLYMLPTRSQQPRLATRGRE